jgi:hypothetical protein
MKRALLVLFAVGCAHVAAQQQPAPARFEDDFDHALAQAKASKEPLVVDVWAPW